jgi:hypothetical protein
MRQRRRNYSRREEMTSVPGITSGIRKKYIVPEEHYRDYEDQEYINAELENRRFNDEVGDGRLLKKRTMRVGRSHGSETNQLRGAFYHQQNPQDFQDEFDESYQQFGQEEFEPHEQYYQSQRTYRFKKNRDYEDYSSPYYDNELNYDVPRNFHMENEDFRNFGNDRHRFLEEQGDDYEPISYADEGSFQYNYPNTLMERNMRQPMNTRFNPNRQQGVPTENYYSDVSRNSGRRRNEKKRNLVERFFNR